MSSYDTISFIFMAQLTYDRLSKTTYSAPAKFSNLAQRLYYKGYFNNTFMISLYPLNENAEKV